MQKDDKGAGERSAEHSVTAIIGGKGLEFAVAYAKKRHSEIVRSLDVDNPPQYLVGEMAWLGDFIERHADELHDPTTNLQGYGD
jgi:hypothetical protein